MEDFGVALILIVVLAPVWCPWVVVMIAAARMPVSPEPSKPPRRMTAADIGME